MCAFFWLTISIESLYNKELNRVQIFNWMHSIFRHCHQCRSRNVNTSPKFTKHKKKRAAASTDSIYEWMYIRSQWLDLSVTKRRNFWCFIYVLKFHVRLFSRMCFSSVWWIQPVKSTFVHLIFIRISDICHCSSIHTQTRTTGRQTGSKFIHEFYSIKLKCVWFLALKACNFNFDLAVCEKKK